ncbi:hypothetical protein Plhal304r1_c007g0027711 [Plasmopara halstedii]
MPLHSHSVGGDEAKTFTRYRTHLRQILLTVFKNLRSAFRLLPVHSRFWFLQQSNPRITYCVCSGCKAVETEGHLFFKCALASRLCKNIENIVAPFSR